MERLIKDGDIILDGTLPRYQKEKNAFLKLSSFEDFEQEFGISLVKLLSVKKVYYMDWNRDCSGFIIKETHKLFINLTDRTIEYYESEYSEFTFDLEIQNYGKKDTFGGWAFTKEELEDENNENRLV